MRIFIASGIFHPDPGGPATYLYRLLPELQARGHEIRALAYGSGPTDGYPYPLTRVPYITLPIRLTRYARAYRQGATWADLIYIHSLSLPRFNDRSKPRVMKVVGDYAWERAVNRGWIPPTEDIDVFQTRRYSPLVEWFKSGRSREVRAMDRVIVPSEYLRRMVIGWGADPARVQVIYNALEVKQYSGTITKAEARDQLGWSLSGRYLITAARLTAWKGIDYLIDAVAQVPGITLAIAGEGSQSELLRKQVADKDLGERVLFLGKVPHDQLAIYMRAADYLALYSGYEGLSHTLLEALYGGTPVIASARGGNPEVVRDGINGLLVEHPNLGALVSALRGAFEGDTPMRLAARTREGLERFSWSALVEQTMGSLEEIFAIKSAKQG